MTPSSPTQSSPWAAATRSGSTSASAAATIRATQDEINAILVREAACGRRVVRLKGGDPLVFGRAGEEMAALRAAKIPFEVVPGVTAALAAAAEAEIPLTLRGTASTLVFATGRDAGGRRASRLGRACARRQRPSPSIWAAPSRRRLRRRLIDAGLGAATPVVVIENATLPERRLFAGALRDLAAIADRTDIAGPTLILIGEAVADGALECAEPLAPERTIQAA